MDHLFSRRNGEAAVPAELVGDMEPPIGDFCTQTSYVVKSVQLEKRPSGNILLKVDIEPIAEEQPRRAVSCIAPGVYQVKMNDAFPPMAVGEQIPLDDFLKLFG